MNDSHSPQNIGPEHGDVGLDAPADDDAADTLVSADVAAILADADTWAEPPAGLGERIVDAVRSEAQLGGPEPEPAAPPAGSSILGFPGRAWLRPALLGAAAAIVLLFGGIVVLSALSDVEEVESFSAALVPTGVIPDVGGDIDIASFDSGLRIVLSAPGLPRRDDGAFYEGWVRTADGNLFPVGTFHDGDDVTLWAGVELDRIELFTITLENAAGPDDPAQASSGEVVLRAPIRP